MLKISALGVSLALAAILTSSGTPAQTLGDREEYTANAIVNNNLGSGAGRVIIRVTRWSTESERGLLTRTLLKTGPQDLLDVLREQKPVGTIRTPDSLGYDLRYAHQEPGQEGGRDIVIATDRPISFWEAANRPRVSDYPFTVIQMHLDDNGEGRGTMSYATKIIARGNTIELENFATSPVMLTEIRAKKID
ncbi:MAG TPA: hypothetical protein VEA16_18825 [Vicinamibacterales bacterium]|nr:hypothetical protein [Vicinamibacterales bacterium]